MNENGEKLYVFQFNEEDVQKLFVLLRDCIGITCYDSLTTAFFRQMKKRRMSKIVKVYKKYKNFDNLLSDKEWLSKTLLPMTLYDLWQAVKTENEKEYDES